MKETKNPTPTRSGAKQPSRARKSRLSPLHDHNHLRFSSARVVYDLVADGGRDVVSVVREAIAPDQGIPTRHVTTITRTRSGDCVFSLLTLGIQPIHHGVKILNASPGTTYIRPGEHAKVPLPQGSLIQGTGLTASSPQKPDPDKVWMICFTGRKCEIEFEPVPDRMWTTKWITDAVGEGHGVEPPQ